MNENEKVTTEEEKTASCCMSLTNAASEKQSCFSKMTDACRMACDRFLRARLLVSYRMTMRVQGHPCISDAVPALSQTIEVQNPKMNRSNVMTKEGNVEIRLSDLTLGLTVMTLACTALCSIKALLCRKCGM